MIPENAITEWGSQVPWTAPSQVEQDLVISRALCAVYNDNFLAQRLAFRGETALHRLFLHPQPRYSEDIDLVQIFAEPIKEIMDHLRDALSFLGEPKKVLQKANNNTIVYKFPSELPPVVPIKLKVEINCREHFSVLGFQKIKFHVKNQWFSDDCEIMTYALDELVGTKLRALYQRKKGRDLFDLYRALKSGNLNIEKAIKCYNKYMEFVVDEPPSKKNFISNLKIKMRDSDFVNDTTFLLRPNEKFDINEAFELVMSEFVEHL